MSRLRHAVDRLAHAATHLAPYLLPGGHREDREWVVPSSKSPFGCSVSIHLYAPRAGIWSAWASGEAGDLLDLIAVLRCNGDKAEALHWAEEWLRVPTPAQPSPAQGTRPTTVGRSAGDINPLKI